ncbi:MAG: hypothetical protein CYPHOPRED_002620 [Cyphobasidiales sp. Tagirdzhanova-0007]|nr:MAG: hypothetical protein CYPHOPRED_002620 [Cyphobasidiales sp. Tagirdzhanova-0007]
MSATAKPLLSHLLSPTLTIPKFTLELFIHNPEQTTCLLNAMNSPTAHARMGDYGIRTPEQFAALNCGTRLRSSVFDPVKFPSGVDVDTDLYYLLRLLHLLDHSAGLLMGGVSLAQRGPNFPPDIGWCILEQFQGKGYAAEAAKALVEYAALNLGISKIMAWPGKNNLPSVRRAQKAGLIFGGTISVDDGAEEVVVYVLPGMDFAPIQAEGTISLKGQV